MKKSGSIGSKTVPIVFSTILILIWLIVVEKGLVERYILPSPIDVVKTCIEMFPGILEHLAITLKEAFTGFAVAIVFSLILAILMDSISIVRKAVYPLLVVSQTIPIIALAPLFAVWFGLGLFPKVIVVFLVCFFPIVVSLVDGLDSVDADLLNLFKSMGAGKVQVFRYLKLPASMVNFFSGLRIAATYSIMGAVIAEWLGGEKGLGIYMLRVKHSYALDKMFAVVLIIVLLSLALFKAIALIERMAMPWYRSLNNNDVSGGDS